MQDSHCGTLTVLSSGYLRKWWYMLISSILFLLIGVLIALKFSVITNFVIDHEIALRPNGKTFTWWANPPVEPKLAVYVYNVTNANEFLYNNSKPSVKEIGPYVYIESWEKVNIVLNKNGTLSYNLRRLYKFHSDDSSGLESDVVIVPNIPMLSATSQSKHAARFLRLAMASIMDILKIKPFVEVSVGQLLWGYEDPLLKLAKDVVPKEQKLPYEEFGLMYGKNGTSEDRITIHTGTRNIMHYGVIDNYNGKSKLSHWLTDKCNQINGTDGSIFPPHIDVHRILQIYDKDLCRLIPLVYQKEVRTKGGIKGFRFTPPKTVFSKDEPENGCFCSSEKSSCPANGLLNVSLCQYDSPIMLSFPHFFLAEEELRLAIDGISPAIAHKHQFFIDVQPDLGTTLRARARIQVNLAVSQVVDIKQVATFPDIIFPIIWFEEGIDFLPDEVTNMMELATSMPLIAQFILSIICFVIGGTLLFLAIFYIIRNSHRQSELNLEASNYSATTQFDLSKRRPERVKN